MLFTFRRDGEGRERIYVGDVCVAHMSDGMLSRPDGEGWSFRPISTMQYVTASHINDAIERADEAGFWHQQETMPHRWEYVDNCVKVDVPIAETSTTLVLVREGDE